MRAMLGRFEVLAKVAFSGGDLPAQAIRVGWGEDIAAAPLFFQEPSQREWSNTRRLNVIDLTMASRCRFP